MEDQKVFLVTQKNPDDENPGQEELFQIGTIAVVKQLVKLPNNIIRVMVEGLELSLIHIFQYLEKDGILTATAVLGRKNEDITI